MIAFAFAFLGLILGPHQIALVVEGSRSRERGADPRGRRRRRSWVLFFYRRRAKRARAFDEQYRG